MTVAVDTAVATWYAIKGLNDLWWRCEVPAKVIGGKVAAIPEDIGGRLLTKPNDGDVFPWHETDEGAEYPRHEGAAVWVRPDSPRVIHSVAMAEQGFRQVAEVDDNYLSNPRFNLYMRQNRMDAKGRLNHLLALASMDAVIFSTDWLMGEYEEAFEKEAHLTPELHVVGNHIDADVWFEPEPYDGPLRVGYMGSPQHVWDVKLAIPALWWAAENGCHVVFIGIDPAEHVGDAFPYEYVPWVDPAEYHRTPLPLDIGVVPLTMNRHTMGKSDIKPLEYGMSGAAVVAQNCPVFNRTYKHEETVLFAGGVDEFGYQLQRLVKDAKLREELVLNMRRYILEERTAQGHADEWRKAVCGD